MTRKKTKKGDIFYTTIDKSNKNQWLSPYLNKYAIVVDVDKNGTFYYKFLNRFNDNLIRSSGSMSVGMVKFMNKKEIKNNLFILISKLYET